MPDYVSSSVGEDDIRAHKFQSNPSDPNGYEPATQEEVANLYNRWAREIPKQSLGEFVGSEGVDVAPQVLTNLMKSLSTNYFDRMSGAVGDTRFPDDPPEHWGTSGKPRDQSPISSGDLKTIHTQLLGLFGMQ